MNTRDSGETNMKPPSTTLQVLEDIRGKIWGVDGRDPPDLSLARRIVDDAIEIERWRGVIRYEAGHERSSTGTAEAYRRFPDDVEPVDYHPAGKIVVDRGNLRYAFLAGAEWAKQSGVPAQEMPVPATPEQVKEACAQVADRAAESDEGYAAKYGDEREKYENRAHRARTIASAIRAQPFPDSAPVFKASHPPRMSAQGERDPSVMPDCAGAETVQRKFGPVEWSKKVLDAVYGVPHAVLKRNADRAHDKLYGLPTSEDRSSTVEPPAHNRRDAGSSPAGPTTSAVTSTPSGTEPSAPALSQHNEFNPEREYPGSYGGKP